MAVVEVVDKECEKTVRFDALEVGETFRFEGSVYLKLSHKCGGATNAYSFRNNLMPAFSDRCGVIPVKCKLIVEG